MAFHLFVPSNLKDIHLNHFIRAAENGHSLVHLDTSNNEGLNSKLVKRLKERLEENALKHPFVVIQPIAISVSDRGLSSQIKQKVLRRDSSSKEIKLKTKTENLPFKIRRVTKDKYVCFSLNMSNLHIIIIVQTTRFRRQSKRIKRWIVQSIYVSSVTCFFQCLGCLLK